MGYASVFRRMGELIGLVGVAQMIPLAWSVYLGSPDTVAFAVSIVASFVLALASRLLFPANGELTLREALVVVVAGWLVAGVVGSVPFIVSGTATHWVDAFFETVSGLTTTGATVLQNVGAQPPGVLMWRAVLQWLGGMGIVVLFVAVFPALGVGGTHLLSAEMAGPVLEKLTPRVRGTAKLLWTLYLALTGSQTVLLMAAGLPAYEALLHAFTTVSTGGFSNQPLSIESYGNPWVERITIVFMFLGGMNFTLQYRAFWLKEWHRLRNTELKGYVAIIIAASALVTVNLWRAGLYSGVEETLRHAVFQVISVLTTTGYSVANYETWPTAARAVLLLLLFTGGMAGSTAGGIKIIRLVVLAKHSARSVTTLLHPHATLPLIIDGKAVPVGVLNGIVQFVFLYFGLFLVSFLVLSFEGYDLVTTASAAIAVLGNIGPGLGLIGPHESYAFFSPWAKLYLAVLMIAGRLEVITLLTLFLPSFWRR